MNEKTLGPNPNALGTGGPGPDELDDAALAYLPLADGGLIATLPSLAGMTHYVLREQGDWFEDELRFIRGIVEPGDRMLDIGANHGVYTVSMAKKATGSGCVWAFEPAARTASLLRRSVARTGLDNVRILQLALSSRRGTATFFTGANSELNGLHKVDGSVNSEETVELRTLDDCDAEFGFRGVSFVKLDAEGEEGRILEGARAFLQRETPLIMFEHKHGAAVNTGLVDAFARDGYATYRLVPGPGALVPFHAEEPRDPFLLNLFCCKPDRADALERAGHLVRQRPELALAEAGGWRELVREARYGQALLPQWSARLPRRPAEALYVRGLDEYAAGARASVSAERVVRLERALGDVSRALAEHGDLSRLLTLARIARELGARGKAVEALDIAAQMFNAGMNLDVEEPFLAPDPRYDDVELGPNIGAWCIASVLETREKTRAWSSYFTGATSLNDIGLLERLGFLSEEMHGRRELVRARIAETQARSP